MRKLKHGEIRKLAPSQATSEGQIGILGVLTPKSALTHPTLHIENNINDKGSEKKSVLSRYKYEIEVQSIITD